MAETNDLDGFDQIIAHMESINETANHRAWRRLLLRLTMNGQHSEVASLMEGLKTQHLGQSQLQPPNLVIQCATATSNFATLDSDEIQVGISETEVDESQRVPVDGENTDSANTDSLKIADLKYPSRGQCLIRVPTYRKEVRLPYFYRFFLDRLQYIQDENSKIK